MRNFHPLPPAEFNRRFRPVPFSSQKGIRSIYEELEHMRLAQEDILRYMLDETWASPSFPDGYWPSNNDDLTEKIWEETVANFFNDLDELIKFVREITIPLFKKRTGVKSQINIR